MKILDGSSCRTVMSRRPDESARATAIQNFASVKNLTTPKSRGDGGQNFGRARREQRVAVSYSLAFIFWCTARISVATSGEWIT